MEIKNKSILYLEDDLQIANSFSRVISLFFTKIVHCKNGYEGLDVYNKYKFDLILSDINMPIMNGLEFIKNIRKLDKKIPIFLVTSREKKDFDFEKLEINGYLQKPLALKEFMDFIKEFEEINRN